MEQVTHAPVDAGIAVYLSVDNFWVAADSAIKPVPAACFCDLRGEVTAGAAALHAKVFWPERTLVGLIQLLGEGAGLPPHWDVLPRPTMVREIAASIAAQYGPVNCIVAPAFLAAELAPAINDLPFRVIDSLSLTAAFAASRGCRRALIMDIQPGWLNVALVACHTDGVANVTASHRWVLSGAGSTWQPAELAEIASWCVQDAGVESGQLDGGLIIGNSDAGAIAGTAPAGAHVLSPAQLLPGVAGLMSGAVRVALGTPHPFTGFLSQRLAEATERFRKRLKQSDSREEANLVRKCELLLSLVGKSALPDGEQWALVRQLEAASRIAVSLGAVKDSLMRALLGGPVHCRSVALVSPFSFGKSTLLNALVGAELLASDFRAETAQIVRIVHAERCAALVERTDTFSLHQADSPGALATILKGLSGVRAHASGHVEGIFVSLPLPEQLRRCQLTDTPGFFSMHAEHDAVADRAWAAADLLVVVNDPAKLGDANFGEKIRAFDEAGKPALYVITKRDQVQGREAALTAELRNALAKPAAPVVHVSGYHGLQGRLWASGQKSQEAISWDRELFVMDGTTLLRGPALQQHHAAAMVAYSNLTTLERLINWMAGGANG